MNLINLNKKVLVIDSNNFINGSWSTIDIFGFKEVENAIHYFLPSRKALNYMKNILKWNVVKSNQKYRVLKYSFFNSNLLKYDNFVGKIISKIYNEGLFKIFNLTFFFKLEKDIIFFPLSDISEI